MTDRLHEHPGDRQAEARSQLQQSPLPPAAPEMSNAPSASGEGMEANSLEERSNLTKSQLAIWVGQKFQPETPLFNLARTVEFAGPFEPDRFQKAFHKLVEITDALRTVIHEQDGVPQQVVLKEMPDTFEWIDFSPYPEPRTQFNQWLREKPLKVFDLSQCLFETILIKLSATCFIWYFNQHHIITDGTSISILFTRLDKLYQEPGGENSIATPSYQDYLEMDRCYRHSHQFLEDAAFWEKKLAAQVQPVSFFNSAPATGPGAVQRISRPLGLERSRRLQAIAAHESLFHKTLPVSISNAMLGLLFAYLHRLSGNQLLSIATITHNRHTADLRHTAGLMIGVLPLRVSIDPGETLVSLIRKVTAETAESLPHSRYTVQNSLHKKAYDVVFNYLTASFSHFAGSPVEYHWLCPQHGTSSLILNLHDFNATRNFTLDFDFLCSAFTVEQRERAIHHFFRWLDALLDNPQQLVAHVQFLSPTEEQSLSALNTATRAPAEAELLHQLFEAQAEKLPTHPAVVFEDATLTYRELNAKANQLARHLKQWHVGPETVVGISLERSPQMIIALLAVLKAGGSYLPLDPTYPKERLAFMVADACPKVILTEQRLLKTFLELDTKLFALDAEEASTSHYPSENLTTDATAATLAYIIYTSGSTGRPKGVQITHGAVVNFVAFAGQAYAISPHDGVLQFASINFDASVEDIFTCLTRGGTLVLRTLSMLDSISTFLQKCAEWNLTVLSLPTAFWHELAARASEEQLTPLQTLRLVIIGGERAIPERLAQWQKWAGQKTKLINTYGPTEATVVTTLCELAPTESAQSAAQEIALGRPLPNTQVYVLDSYLQPVPLGVTAELYIGGLGLARGYLNQPDLTAQKFLRNPFSLDPAARLYQTGDLVRLREDGHLEFAGRTDQQIKIRGFRVEPEEIEAVLSMHPALQQVAVAVQEQPSGQKQLTAFVTVGDQASPTKGELRKFLALKLPDYMIPASFHVLDRMPLTANGKLDRAALTVPPETSLEKQSPAGTVFSPLEEIVAGIWSQVLSVPEVGLQDNFFEIGGHSLMVSQVISRVRVVLQIEISLRSFFEAPTIAGLAKLIQKTQPRGTLGGPNPSLDTTARISSHAPLSYAQQRLWFLDQLEPNSSAYNIPVSVRLRGPLNIPALEAAVNAIIKRHKILRTTFKTAHGQPVQMLEDCPALRVTVIDLSSMPIPQQEEEIRRLTAEEAARGFDLSRWPLMRTTVLHLGNERSLFLLTMQHIISDGWSLNIFFRELSSFYSAFCEGKPAMLPDLPVQYADVAAWQQVWLESGVLEKDLDYWKRQLAGAPTVLELPCDFPRPLVQSFRGAELARELSRDTVEALKRLSQKEGVTLYMTLLAAFQTMLSRHTGQEDVVLGTAIAGRNRAEFENLIGFFVNTLVLRTDLSGNPTFKQLLQRVRETFLGAYEHQNLPFEKLVEHLHPERSPSRTPLVQVFFNLLSPESVRIAFPGVTVENFQLHSAGSKFDLTLYVKESPKGSELKLVYNEDIFSQAHMEDFLEQYEQLLQQISKRPEEQIHSFSLLTARAKVRLPNPAQVLEIRGSDSIHARLSQWAFRFPKHLAVVEESCSITYAELEARSNQLAHYLRSTGLKPQEVVAVYAHRDASLVWALLGVLKAGAVFFILDPAYPASRLLERLRVASPKSWLLLESAGDLPPALEKHLAETDCARLVLSGNTRTPLGAPLKDFPKTPPNVTIDPDDLAYIAFTSGTTGEQKGILGTHRPLTHFLDWQAVTFNLTRLDRFSMLSGLSHDPLLRDIFAPLWVGATLCIPDPNDFEAPVRLAHWMEKSRVSVTHLTPALSRWLGEATSANMKSLRYVFLGGDMLTSRDVAMLKQIAPGAHCVNFYGATETPQAMGCFKVRVEAGRAWDTALHQHLPIGQGIADVQLLVLNSSQQLAGISELGEICVRTPYLAQGYLGDFVLTQARFVVNPFTNSPQDRLYRTGDLGRFLPDGLVQLVGRMDDQLILRGFRIEPGEVAACLQGHPQIRQACAVAAEDAQGDKCLIAYFVPEEAAAPTHGQLRDFLKQRLPDFMMPSAFVALAALPRTPNGKIDRRALPAPNRLNGPSRNAFIPPRDLLEVQLAQIWESVLGHYPIGMQDNFFELGGHSLLAVRLFARIENALGQRLPLATLFMAPTIEQLAAVFRRDGWKQAWSSLVPIQLDGSKPPFFCVHGVGGNVLNYRDLARHLGSDQPVYGLQSVGLNGNQAPLTSFEQMATHYIREMRTLQREGPYFVGGLSFGGLIAYEIACQLESAGQKVALVALFDTSSRGSLETLPQSQLYQRQLNFYWRRIKYSLTQLLVGPNRWAYIRGKSKTIWRKIESKLWQTKRKLGNLAGQPLPRGYFNVKQANYLASKQFVPKTYSGRVILFRAQERPIEYHLDRTLGWQHLAQGGVDVYETPGSHTTLILEPHAPVLARQLKACIEETLPEDFLMQANSGC